MSGKLLALSKPKVGEGPCGFLVRLAYENQCPVPELFDLVDIKPELVFSRGHLKDYSYKLAAALEWESDQIQPLFEFPAMESKRLPGYHRELKILTETERTFIGLGRPRICTVCVEENGQWRREWEFTAFTFCSTHRVALADYCENCKEVFDWKNISLRSCENCGMRHSGLNVKPFPCDPTLSDLTLWLLNGKVGPCPQDLQDVLVSRLDFESFTHLFVGLSTAFTHQQRARFSHRRPWDVPNFTLVYLSQIIRGLFQSWPQGTLELLKEFVNGFAVTKGAGSHTLPLKPLIEGLHGFPLDRSLRITLEKGLIDTYQLYLEKKNNFSTEVDRIVFPLPAKSPGNRAQVASFLRVSGQFVKALAEEDILVSETGTGEMESFTAESINYARRMLQRSLSLRDAADVLGVSEHNLKMLLNGKVLKAWRGPLGDTLSDTSGEHLVLGEDIQRLFASLDKIPLRANSTESELVSLQDAVTGLITASGLQLPDLVLSFQSGKIAPLKYDNTLPGLCKYQFAKTDLAALVLHSVRPINKCSVQEASERLGVYPDLVRNLLREGYLGESSRELKTSEYLIEKAAVEAFDANFVTITTLGAQWDLSPQNLGDRLLGLGVRPVAGPGQNDVLVRLYRRSETARLTRREVAGVKVKTTNAGRPPKGKKSRLASATEGFITAGEACARLGCSAQELTRLVSEGMLKKADVPGVSAQKRYFENSAVEQYLLQFTENAGLLTVEKTLKELGVLNVRDLHRRWIARKMLSPVNSGLAIYFALAEVQACKTEAEATMTTQQVAAALDTTAPQVRNWVNFGKIAPVSGPGIDRGRIFLFERSDVLKMRRDKNNA